MYPQWPPLREGMRVLTTHFWSDGIPLLELFTSILTHLLAFLDGANWTDRAFLHSTKKMCADFVSEIRVVFLFVSLTLFI